MSSLLSHCACFLRDHLVLSDHVDATGTKLYPQSFTMRELKSALRTYISGRTSVTSTLIEALIASLEAQFFFYNATWKSVERATDDDICILLRCDVYEGQPASSRPKLSSPSAFISAVTPFAESSGAGVSLITSSPAPQRQDEPDSTCRPTGVMPLLSKCYSSTCDESDPCYSFSCPNRNKKKKFTVKCYSNSCSNGYGCYSPTCPCRYENGPDAEIDDQSTVISVEVRSPSPPIDAMPGQPTPKSVYDLPKLSLGEGASEAPVSDIGQITTLHSPFISSATGYSTYSFTSSLTPSSPYSSTSPFSPATWDPSSPIGISNDIDIDLTQRPVAQTLTLPRIYTHLPYTGSYQTESPSPYSSPHYARSPVDLSTPLSPNWEPLLLISMIGPSVTWVNQERSSSSGTPTSAHENNPRQSRAPITHPSPRTYHPFSSILKSCMGNDRGNNESTLQNTETDLLSPTTPYSPYSPYPQ